MHILQVGIAEKDRDKTAFKSYQGFIGFTHTLFGLIKAPETFQRAMDFILSKIRFKLAIVHLDGI